MSRGEMRILPEGPLIKHSGVGAKPARLSALALLDEGATALLSWGSAGGLRAAISPGSLILPKTIFSSDQATFTVDTTWHERLHTMLKGHIGLFTQPLIESPSILRKPSEKAALFRQSGAIAVDMESAAIAQTAMEACVPFMAIRVVVDPPHMTVPACALAAVDESGTFRALRLLKSLIRRPKDLIPLARLGRNFRSAQATLSKVVGLTGNKFLAP
jgi:adenosylhomocysteine nucleosidase